jgi:hypothetical protein
VVHSFDGLINMFNGWGDVVLEFKTRYGIKVRERFTETMKK